ncbi:hypothetical protein EUGRSUZ_L00421 [Eucalyptus grandis]|uniref:Uncharacterized protein n=1 Tax=Eucalyptus grandis TaxID=71139 RepID=A0A058ZVB6_EUCGR|nr:hypothetical protein EUGRSUZ_L00421 [Eucalyptus grandis]
MQIRSSLFIDLFLIITSHLLRFILFKILSTLEHSSQTLLYIFILKAIANLPMISAILLTFKKIHVFGS